MLKIYDTAVKTPADLELYLCECALFQAECSSVKNKIHSILGQTISHKMKSKIN